MTGFMEYGRRSGTIEVTDVQGKRMARMYENGEMK